MLIWFTNLRKWIITLYPLCKQVVSMLWHSSNKLACPFGRSTSSSPSVPAFAPHSCAVLGLSLISPLVPKQAVYCACSAVRPAPSGLSFPVNPRWGLTHLLPPIWPPSLRPHWLILTSPSLYWLHKLSHTVTALPTGQSRATEPPRWPDKGSDASKWLVVFRSLPTSSHGALVQDECLCCRRRKLLCNYRE